MTGKETSLVGPPASEPRKESEIFQQGWTGIITRDRRVTSWTATTEPYISILISLRFHFLNCLLNTKFPVKIYSFPVRILTTCLRAYEIQNIP